MRTIAQHRAVRLQALLKPRADITNTTTTAITTNTRRTTTTNRQLRTIRSVTTTRVPKAVACLLG
jgi:hypothetical protein